MPTSTVKKTKPSATPMSQSPQKPLDNQPKPKSTWWCETCRDGKDLTPEEMTAHLLEHHHINICRTPYTRTSFPVRRERGWLIETYEMVVAGKIVLTNEQVIPIIKR